MPKVLEEKDWDILLKRIKNGKCTPFLGSGACSEKISVISQLANEWAKKYDYPVEDSYDLARMAQFVAVVKDFINTKEVVCKIQEAFTNSSLLFLAHRIDDWDFRFLCRILAGYLEKSISRTHISVRLMPENVSITQKEKAQKYLDRYFEDLHIQVYWHYYHEVSVELRTRREAFNSGI
ncbi:hypothetical protein [Methanosarcina sp.]|uniref:hypothetical protein n=1 Tax=Methanosarcina sp. TaxID=2213 RepID=UPI0029888F7E|nr:hypothetical protein [Methanosarcina sp.]MDW5551008.1 hypothetical protein [Methanosarcina sp.]MDW5555392.1 hypothetical protein [Methanosarcina sp.]MDW5561036.1 hypothetical protein [Methanosarcina sp.]